MLDQYLLPGEKEGRTQSDGEQAVRDQLNKVLLGGGGTAVCFVAMEPLSDNVLLGRADVCGELTVALPIKTQLRDLLARWRETVDANKQQLDALDSCEKWSDKEKARWTKAHNLTDTTFGALLDELQTLLGPWRVILCGSRSQRATDSVTSLGAALTTMRVSSSKAGTTSKATTTTSSGGGTSVDKARSACSEWIDLVQTSAGDGCISAEEALLALGSVVSDWDEMLSPEQAAALAEQLLTVSTGDQGTVTSSSKDSAPGSNFEALKLPELKKALKDLGVAVPPSAKLKADLVALLQAHSSSAGGKGTSASAAASGTESNHKAAHTVLLLDKDLQALPWEAMACMRASSASRMPSLALLLSLGDRWAAEERPVAAGRTWYALDVKGNLPKTTASMQPFLAQYAAQYAWTGFVNREPDQTALK